MLISQTDMIGLSKTAELACMLYFLHRICYHDKNPSHDYLVPVNTPRVSDNPGTTPHHPDAKGSPRRNYDLTFVRQAFARPTRRAL